MVSASPHWPQKREDAGLSLPHAPHGRARDAPHELKNRCASSFACWHAAHGLADLLLPSALVTRGAAVQLLPRLAPNAGWVSMKPKLYDMFAVVHRAGATLSPAAQLMIELATKRIQSIATPM